MTKRERYNILIRAAALIETGTEIHSCYAIMRAMSKHTYRRRAALVEQYCKFYGQEEGTYWLGFASKDEEIRDYYAYEEINELRVMLLLWFAEVTCA